MLVCVSYSVIIGFIRDIGIKKSYIFFLLKQNKVTLLLPFLIMTFYESKIILHFYINSTSYCAVILPQ